MPKSPGAEGVAVVGVLALAVVPPSVVPVAEPRLPKRPPVAGFMPKKAPPGAFPPEVPVAAPVAVPPPKSEGGAVGAPVPPLPLNSPPPVEVVVLPPPSPVANEPKVDPDGPWVPWVPCVPVFCWVFFPAPGKLKPPKDIFVRWFKLRTALDPPTTAMTAPLARYEAILIGNASTIATIESSLRSVAWILPGRFKDAELASEARM